VPIVSTIKFDCSLRRREDEVVLRVSPHALDRAFQATADPGLYELDDWRLERLLEMPEGTRVAAPKIGALDGRICFEDGRHRARIAKLQGRKVIPVLVRKDNITEVRELLSKFSGKKRPDSKTCEQCGIYAADPPSRLCAGCEAYQAHQA
jgi:hypothetical protein